MTRVWSRSTIDGTQVFHLRIWAIVPVPLLLSHTISHERIKCVWELSYGARLRLRAHCFWELKGVDFFDARCRLKRKKKKGRTKVKVNCFYAFEPKTTRDSHSPSILSVWSMDWYSLTDRLTKPIIAQRSTTKIWPMVSLWELGRERKKGKPVSQTINPCVCAFDLCETPSRAN